MFPGVAPASYGTVAARTNAGSEHGLGLHLAELAHQAVGVGLAWMSGGDGAAQHEQLMADVRAKLERLNQPSTNVEEATLANEVTAYMIGRTEA